MVDNNLDTIFPAFYEDWTSLDQKYTKMLLDLYDKGDTVKPRGMEVKEILGYTFRLNNLDNNIITVPGFETNIDYAKEELNWYMAKTNRIDWSPKIEKIWKKYSDDGVHINSNYGYRIFGKHPDMPGNQWEQVKEELKNDRDSRRAVMNINSSFDKLHLTSKDIPCTIAIQSFIRNDCLDWVVYMRSNDVNKGFRNDLYCFTEMQKIMAKELNINTGRYIHTVGSMHLYKEDYAKVEKLWQDRK